MLHTNAMSSTELGVMISLIVVGAIAIISLGYIWWKTSKIKKEVKEGTFLTKEEITKLKKEGVNIKKYKQHLKEDKVKKGVKSHEDYMKELRGME